MNPSSLILLLNTINSILHPIKHIPQIIHTLKTKSVNDLSLINIICELGLNLLSVISFLLMYFCMEQKIFFIPIIIEKFSSTIFITTIFYLKRKYTNTEKSTYNEIKPLI